MIFSPKWVYRLWLPPPFVPPRQPPAVVLAMTMGQEAPAVPFVPAAVGAAVVVGAAR